MPKRKPKSFAKLRIYVSGPPPEDILNKLPSELAVDDIEIFFLQRAASDISDVGVPATLKTLIINSPGLSGEQLEGLQRKLPGCKVLGYDTISKTVVYGG